MGGSGGMYDTQMPVRHLARMGEKFGELASLAQTPIAHGREVFIGFANELEEIVLEISRLGKVVENVPGLSDQIIAMAKHLADHIKFGKDSFYTEAGYEAHRLIEPAIALYSFVGAVEPLTRLFQTLEGIDSHHKKFEAMTQNPEVELVIDLITEHKQILKLIIEVLNQMSPGNAATDPANLAGMLSRHKVQTRELRTQLGM